MLPQASSEASGRDPISVAIPPALRGRVEEMTKSAAGVSVFSASEGDGSQALPDVVVSAVEALGETRERFPGVPVVVVCQADEEHAARRALSGGADGVVLDTDLGAAFVHTIRAVAAGQLTLPRSLRQYLDRPMLTPREKQILGMVVMDFPNAAIARRLHVTETTVKSHLTSAFRKLGVRSRKEAAALILDADHGLGTGILGIPQK